MIIKKKKVVETKRKRGKENQKEAIGKSLWG